MVGLVIYFLVSGLTAYLAKRKGYSPYIWFFAAGILGLIVLAFLPNVVTAEGSDEEKAKRIKTGNIIGGVVIGVAILLSAANLLIFRARGQKLVHEASIAVCEGYADQIGLALWNYPKDHDGKNPDSLHDPAFVSYMPHGKLPEHPAGRDWDRYYDKDKGYEKRDGKVAGILDTTRACDF